MNPVITIFVRHGDDCKYKGDEFSKRCQCRKHLRWTHDGIQHRRKAETRSWAEAEELKRKLEDQLAGRAAKTETTAPTLRTIRDGIDLFIKNKTVEGVTEGTLKKYTGELERLRSYCETVGVYAVAGLTVEVLTGYAATWAERYPSSVTRSKVRERLKTFLRFCYEAQWLPRIPSPPKIKVDALPTMPLTEDQYKRLLDGLYVVNPRRWDGKLSTRGLTDKTHARVRALIQLMRWSGLAIQDAATIRKDAIIHDATSGRYRVETSRQKTGVHVSVVIPNDVALEVLAVAEPDCERVFWTGDGLPTTIAKTWANRYIRPAFEAAGIECDGHMVSHRLRDTFAVHLLEKGVPLEDVSKALGHESIKTTEKHYAKWVQGRQNRLDGLIAATWE